MLRERFPDHVPREVMRQSVSNKLWRENDTPESVEKRALLEYEELKHEININPEIAFLVAGEIGDILYLALKYEDLTGRLSFKFQLMTEEAFELCELTGLDPIHCVIMKILRNDLKYPSYLSNNGFRFDEFRLISKNMYDDQFGGDSWFSTLWETYGEVITHDVILEKTRDQI